MKKRVIKMFNSGNFRFLANDIVWLIALVAFVSCNADFRPSFKESITDSKMRSCVSRVIDAQLENIRGYLDEELRAEIDGTGNRGSRGLSGSDIVERTLKESGGRDYLDFCYAVDVSQTTGNVDDVMDTARYILPSSDYEKLVEKTEDIKREISLKGEEMSRMIPVSQQEAFFHDLKILVTRAIVLLIAGIVYACVPRLVFWGKVSAAAAISVGAGLVAISVMSLYEYFKFGTGEGMSFEDWFKDLLKIPQADFALTTAVTSMAEAMGTGPVVTGIIICVYGLFNVAEMVRTMMKTYNFDA